MQHHDMAWFFTIQGPRENVPTLLSSAIRAFPPASQSPFIGLPFCSVYPMLPGTRYTLTHDPFLSQIQFNTIVLREGESAIMKGLIGEADGVSSDCGSAPNYIPSHFRDNQGCLGVFTETFTFDDFIDGGGISSASDSVNTTDCTFEFYYSATVMR
jgi:hypothetical protein